MKRERLLDTVLWWEIRSKDRPYLERKRELIKRDPIASDFTKALNSYRPSDAYHTEYVYTSALGSSEKVLFESYKRPPKLEKLKRRLEKKWAVSIVITAETNHVLKLKGKEALVTQEPFTIHHFGNRRELIDELSTDDDNKLILQFDLRLLNKSSNTEAFVKNTVWEVLKKQLTEREEQTKDRIRSIRSSALFDKYLKRYDLHMGDRGKIPKGFSFRQIAFLEYAEKRKPGESEKVKKELKDRKNIGPVKGEDSVEESVKYLYQIINEKEYPSRKKLQLFMCPIHKEQCPEDCKHLSASMRIFNNRFKLRRMLFANNIEEVADPKGEKPPAKSLSSKIKGYQKKLDSRRD